MKKLNSPLNCHHRILTLFFIILASAGSVLGQNGQPVTQQSGILGNLPGNIWRGTANYTTTPALTEGELARGKKGTSSVAGNPGINFTTFSATRLNKSSEVAQYNKGHEQDPELGLLFSNAPCEHCYELLDRRTETQKYFVQEGSDTKQFVLQSGQYPMHYKDAKGHWRTITDHLEKDKANNAIYKTTGRPYDVIINAEDHFAKISSAWGGITYNNGLELVYIHPDGTEQSLGVANWNNYTAGDNGVRVLNAWPGIDIEMSVLVNSLKTNFVINNAMPAYANGKLVLRDHLKFDNGIAIDAAPQKGFSGAIALKDIEGKEVFTIQQAVAYEQTGGPKDARELNYVVKGGDVLDIEVPGDLLTKPAASYPLVVDPLVTGILSSGFTFNTTATWPPAIPSTGAYCTNVNNVSIPAAATLSDIQMTFTYYGPPATVWAQSRLAFQINGLCTYGWLSCGTAASSSGIPGNTCGLVNSSFWAAAALWGTTSGCVPAYNCDPYTLPFQLLLTQQATSTAACAQTVYATASGFTVNVFGSVATLPAISPSGASTLCMPSTLTLTGSPAGGTWSSSSAGVATVTGGVVTGVSNGTTNITYTSSACTTYVPVTVGTTPTVSGTPGICFPGSTTLTGTPAGGTWTSSAPGVATVASGVVTGVSIGTTIVNYNTGICSVNTPVDVNDPAAVTPLTQPTGISFSGITPTGGTVNFTPNGSTGYLIIASTSSTLSASPVMYTTYSTGSSFGGGIVIQGSTSGSAPSYTTTLLNSNTHYYIFVFAFNNNCTGPQYNTTAPLTGNFNTCVAVPGIPTVTASGTNSITISWGASPAGGGVVSPINYMVYAYSNPGMTILVPGYPVAAGTGTTYTATGLGTGTQYWFTVAAADACAIMSGFVSGMTTCTAVASIPYLQTFDASTTIGDHNPNCMTSNVQNCVFSAVQTSVTYTGTINTNHTTGGSKFYNFFPGGACSAGWGNQWLLTPGLAMTAGTTYRLSFWYRTDGNTWPSLQIQYSTVAAVPAVTSSSMGGTPVPIGPGLTSVNTTTYTQYIQNFTPATSGVYYVGFDAAATGIAALLALDDIEICAVPNVTVSSSAPPYCDPANVLLTSTGTTGAITYAWSGPSSFSSTLAYPSLSGLGVGVYTYSLSAVNDPVSAGYGGYCSASATTTFTVNPQPAAITGVMSICTGQTTTLSNTVGGGSWSSSVPAVGTINAVTGVFAGIAGGTTVITYASGGCYATAVVTVIAMPGPITGNLINCLGTTTTLSNSVTGGTWSCACPAILSIGASTGIVTGISLGPCIVTYSTGTSCYVTAVVTVNPFPGAITGPTSVCVGSTIPLSSSTPGGIWTSSVPAVATIGISSGLVSGLLVGTTLISYRVAGCAVTRVQTVVATPPPIVGPTTVCLTYPTITLTNLAAGGTWSSSNGNVSINPSTGVATGNVVGSSIITYSVSAGCNAVTTVTVLPSPGAITGPGSVCVGGSIIDLPPIGGGTWSSSGGNISVGLATGVINGLAVGTEVLTYTTPSGCISTRIITVNPLPAPITVSSGTNPTCPGVTLMLFCGSGGGFWSSSNPAVATVDATGLVTPMAGGTTPTISYTLPTGCLTTIVVTINPNPSPIAGTLTLCTGGTTALSSTPSGGAWSSSATAIADISGTGVVTGYAPGTSTISYILSTGCKTGAIVTVNPGPSGITGGLGICVGTSTSLSSSTPGGTWSGSPAGIATVSSSGLVTGLAVGIFNTTYTAFGCYSTVAVTVNAVPGPIGGTLSVCAGSVTTLTDPTLGGSWMVDNPSIGTIDAVSGLYTGISGPGTATVTYSLGSGCTTNAIVTVNPLPGPISGPLNICSGFTGGLTSSPDGGTWASSATGTASVGIGTGVVTGGATPGTANITYTLAPSGCMRSVTVTVNSLPSPIIGSTAICVGSATLLSSTPSVGTWSSGNPSVGTVGATTGIVYGVAAGTTMITYTAPVTGCVRTIVILVNPLPTSISGSLVVCEGATTTLTGNPLGGTWQSGTTATATIGAGSGVVTGGTTPGTSIITYTLASSCALSAVVTVNPLPSASTGILTMCVGSSTTLSNVSPGGTWTSGNTPVATVGLGTGIVNGISAGGSFATAPITYTLSTGCKRATTVTVYAVPSPISGPLVVCEGTNVPLGSTPAGGTWTSGASSIASVNPVTGVVTGVSGYGTSPITYTLGTGCQATAVETVNPLPATITGGFTTCVGTTTTLNSTTAGGNWTSGNTGIATVNPSTGVVTGISGGTGSATVGITYTLPTGCRTSAVVTVYALPASITGPASVCVNSTITLSNTSTGGSWSSSNPVAGTIDAVTGVLTGLSGPSTTMITYTLGSGCIRTTVVSVNPLPTAITGILSICIGQTTPLGSTPSGGSWTSSNGIVASIGGVSGILTGNVSGNSTISYMLSTGCVVTATAVVNGLPGSITGIKTVCENATTTLSCLPAGGVWTTASGNISIAASTGVVTGITAGTAVVTYTLGTGCVNTATVTVNPLPAPIGGSLNVCEGLTTALTETTGGGIWNSGSPGIAGISAAGVVTGNVAGTSLISYTLPTTGCIRNAVVTVNPIPAAIFGSSGFCNLSSTTMVSPTPGGGTWGSLDPGILAIDAVTGVATGVSVGTGVITFKTPAGCTTSKSIEIILAPLPITGANDVCIGSTITLGNVITGGTWSSTNPANAPVNIYTGVVTGINAGTTSITYVLSTGCASGVEVTVNPVPAGIAGSLNVCEGSTTTLSNPVLGGTWASSDVSVASIDAISGLALGIAAGTTNITYSLSTGCNAALVLTVNPLPAPITGQFNVCVTSCLTLSDITPGGVWSSSAVGTAYIGATSGAVCYTNTGNATITYTTPKGCIATQEITINPMPSPINGPHNVCQQDSVILTCATPGGVWVSSDPAIATVSSVGVVTGITGGIVTISYILPSGCLSTYLFTVNALPADITGSLAVCAGFSSNLTDATPGGVWTSDPSAASVGTVHHLTGVLTGITPGTVNITYTLGTGCKTMATGTVIVLPAPIGGSPYVCVGQTSNLSNPVSGGSWSSSNPARATVDATSGAVTGISAGPATITYMVGTGCFNVLNITVNPLPAPITGPSEVCEQSTITLADASTPGIWLSGNPSVATINYLSGVLTGISGATVGTVLITYQLPTGCMRQKTITVNVTPPAIIGSAYICQESTVLMVNSMAGGVWSSSNPAVATISPIGVVTPVTLGTSVISYTLATGCQATKMVTVSPLPQVYNVTGGGTYCAGGNGVLVGLDGSQPGVSYALYYGASATGYHTGTGLAFDFGLETMAGIYTVHATYALSGCQRDMAGSKTVTITPLTPLTVGISTGSGDSSCPGNIVNLVPVVPVGVTSSAYAWSVNGVSVSTGNTYSFIPANGDIVSVSMTGTGNCLSGTAATGAKTLTVLPSAMPVVNVLATPGDTICQFNTATFTADPVYGGSAPAYSWMVNGITAGSGPVYSYVPVNGDIVTVQMTSNYLCRQANTAVSSGVPMTVDSIRTPHVSVIPDTSLTIVAGQPVTLYAIVTNAGPSPLYQWIVNGHPIAGATNDSYTANYHDYDSVTCKVTTSGICANIGTFDWVFITVIPTAVQPSGSRLSDIRLMPNPNNGQFTLKGSLGTAVDEELDMEITDMLGQVVYRSKVIARKGRIEAEVTMGSTLANGMYLLNLHSAGNKAIFHFVLEQ